MKILPTALLRLCAVLIGVVAALATLSVPADAATTVQISGSVTNTDGVNQKGSVYVQRVGSNSASGYGLSGGQFSFTWDTALNPADDYLLYVRSSTMDDTERYFVDGDPGGTADAAQATRFHLGPDSASLNLSMVMPAIATVSGKAVDPNGVPIAGLVVTLSEDGKVLPQVSTAADGTFSFGYVAAGTWPVVVHGGTDHLTVQTSITVPASGAVVIPDIVVHEAASIQGQVTDSVSGVPVPFVQVQAFNATTHASVGSPVETDAAGHYRITKLGSTPFVLRFVDILDGYTWTLNDGGNPNSWNPQTPITLGEGEARVYDQALVLKPEAPAPAHTLSGTVSDPGGHPVPAIQVSAAGLTTTTDRRGHWFLAAPDGKQTVGFSQTWHWAQAFGTAPGWAVQYFPTAFAPASATQVTVAGGVAVDHLDVSLRRAGRLSGTVLTPDAGMTPDTHEVWVYDETGALISDSDEQPGASYSVDVPADVPVRLLARAAITDDLVVDYLPRWLGDVDSFAAATPVTVAPGGTKTVGDIHLGSSFGVVSAPAVSGTPVVGGVLTASTGTWTTMTLTQFDTTWWRGSTQVGSGASYLVTPGDAGSLLQARVTASNSGHTATASSAPAGIDRLTSVVAGRGASPKRGVVRLTITVSATGLAPTGTLTVKRGAKVVKAAVAIVNGRAVMKLKRQQSGTRRYTVAYAGSPQIGSSTTTVKVRVR